MTTHKIQISFIAAEGMLLRLLGLIERRGFTVRGLHVPESAEAPDSAIFVLSAIDAARRIEQLQRQIERLEDVRGTQILAA